MRLCTQDSVRALLPVLALALCHGCGGGGGGGASAPVSQNPPSGSAPAPSPAPAPAPVPAPAPANSAPTISVAAPEVAQVGEAFEFQPVATDSDGDTLTFSAANLPPWAQLDSSSGRITGTPGSADVGEYESVTLTVADATHRTDATPFSIMVEGSGAGVASLQWEVPPTKVDGTPLEDLAGYRICYGRDPEDMDHSIYIANPAQTSFEFTTLGGGTWYFAVIAVDAGGLEGPPTSPAMKTI